MLRLVIVLNVVIPMFNKVKKDSPAKPRIYYHELSKSKKKGKVVNTKKFDTAEKQNKKKTIISDVDLASNYFVRQRNETA